MKVIMVEENVWKQLNERIDAIADYVKRQEDKSYDDLWFNNREVCQYLKLSEKTLYRLRVKGDLTYSKICGQYFYTLCAIKDMLKTNVVKSTGQHLQELIEKGREHIKKGRSLRLPK